MNFEDEFKVRSDIGCLEYAKDYHIYELGCENLHVLNNVKTKAE
jgi:hypothetical protein